MMGWAGDKGDSGGGEETDAQDDGVGGVSAVQCANAPDQAVVERGVVRIAVLMALYRLMVRGTVVMCVDLPAVGAQIIVGALADLLLHKPQTAHYISPHGGFQRSMHTAAVLDHIYALIGQVLCCLPDGCIVIRRAGGDLHKREVHALVVHFLQGLHASVGGGIVSLVYQIGSSPPLTRGKAS